MTVHGGYRGIIRDALNYLNASDPASPDTYHRRNQPRIGLQDDTSDHPALTDAVMTTVSIWLPAGETITAVTFVAGATAANTPANWWVALYDPDGALLEQSADQTTGAIAADTEQTLDLANPVLTDRSGFYYVGIMVNATAVPSLLGTVAAPATVTGERNLAQTSGSALTATAPATIATPTEQLFVPYVVLT